MVEKMSSLAPAQIIDKLGAEIADRALGAVVHSATTADEAVTLDEVRAALREIDLEFQPATIKRAAAGPRASALAQRS